MKKVEKIITVISNVLSFIGLIALVCMMGIVFIDVFSRSVLHRTLFLGTTEMAQVCFLCMLTGVPLVILRNDNTMVDVFIKKFPRPLRRVINLITVTATAVVLALIGWQMIKSGQYAQKHNLAYTMSRIPQNLVYYMFGVSCLVMVLTCVVTIVREWIADSPKNVSETKDPELPSNETEEVE